MAAAIEGAKKGGGHAAVEAPDTRRSVQTAQVVDLWCEGEIEGLVNGLKSVYLDGVPVENADGSLNFENVLFAHTHGTQGQAALPGFDQVQNEVAVGVTVLEAVAVTRTVTNPAVGSVRVTIAVPQMTSQDPSSGDLNGSSFEFVIDVQSDGGGFVERVRATLAEKLTSVYKFAKKIELAGPPPWDIRVRRISADSSSAAIVNAFSWDSYTEIQSLRLRYPNSALGALQVSARQFNRVPQRAYDLLLMRLQVPSNWNPITRVYSGTWDGTFQIAWTDNPAWIFRELATHPRWGLGQYVSAAQVNKWQLYKIAQYCDGLVDRGNGQMEPRFTCNLYLQTREQARKVLQDLAAVFRAIAFWAGGELQVVQDAPADPVLLFTPANVVDGAFEYQGQSGLQRHSVFIVHYNDLTQLGKRVPEVYAPDDLVTRYGIRELELSPIGVTSRGQAQRLARWAAYSEEMESELVAFRVGAEGQLALPGQVFQISDPNEAGERLGGRIHAATASQVTLDAPVTLAVGEAYTLTVQLPDPAQPNAYLTQTRAVTDAPGGPTSVIHVSPAFSAAPPVQGTWLLASDAVLPTTWRCMSVAEVAGEDEYELVGVAHNPDKYALIEQGIALKARPISRLTLTPPAPVPPLAHAETRYRFGAGYRSRLTVSWAQPAQGLLYALSWRLNGGPWTDLPLTSGNCLDVDGLGHGTVDLRLRSVNSLGNASAAITATAAIGGRALALAIKPNQSTFAGALNYNECYIHGVDLGGNAIDAAGAVLVNGLAQAVPNGALYASQGPQQGWVLWDSAGETFATNLGNRPFVFVRKLAGQWQYDNNTAWTNFTPSATQYLIGSLEAGGAEGGTVGFTAAVMWSEALAPEGLVSLGDTSLWTGVSDRPRLFRLAATGWADTQAPVAAGLYNVDPAALLEGAARSYNFARIRRSDAAVVATSSHDLLGDPGFDLAPLVAAMRQQLAPMSATPYVPAQPHGLGNFFVRPDTSHGATRDGTSYATAWGGAAEIVWASLGANKTLWICGTWVDTSLSVLAGGASGQPFDIRLDHATDPASIWNSTPIDAGDWTASGVNGEYWIGTVGGSPIDSAELMLYVDGERSHGCSKTSGNTRNVRLVAEPTTASFNAGNSSFTFFSLERNFETGDKVLVPTSGDLASLPAPLVRHTQYYAIALAPDTLQFAASPADALAGTYIPITDAGDGEIWKLFHETPAQAPYLDPQVGSLQPGQHWWDGVNSRLYWKPPAGVPADYETSLSLDRSVTAGAALYVDARDYVRIWGGGEYGGLFGVAPKGRVGRCHTNAIQFVNCEFGRVDGVEISGCRSGLAYAGGTGHVSRNCRIKDSGWHGVGGESGQNLETNLLHERHWITDVGRRFDWGDMQAVVFNAGNDDSHIRRCLVQRSGRNAANCNHGVFVIDSSSRSHVYRNIVDDCYGSVLEVGAGSDHPDPPRTNVDSSFSSNISYRQNRDLGGYGSNQAFKTSVYQFRTQKADSYLARFKAFGNLVAYCRSPSDSAGEARGLALLRSTKFTDAIIEDVDLRRNAAVLLPLSEAMWNVASLALQTPTPPHPAFTSDYNLWSASWPFLRRQRTGETTVTYAADHVVGPSAGYWSYDSGQDAHSEVAPATDIDLDDAPELSAEMLELLRQDDGWDTLVAPTLAGVGQFPLHGGGDAAAAAALAAELDATDAAHIAAVWTLDDACTGRLASTLLAAMYRCGASPGVYGSPKVRLGSAYALVGAGGCGQGNGFEAYQGSDHYDTNAWTDAAFTLKNGQLIVSGTSATPRSLADYEYTGDLDATKGATFGKDINGQARTEDIEPGALSAYAFANASAAAAASVTWTTILTCEEIDVGSTGRVILQAMMDFINAYGTFGEQEISEQAVPEYRLMRDATVLATWAPGLGGLVSSRAFTGYTFLDQPGSGPVVYSLQHRDASSLPSSAQTIRRTLTALGVKR